MPFSSNKTALKMNCALDSLQACTQTSPRRKWTNAQSRYAWRAEDISKLVQQRATPSRVSAYVWSSNILHDNPEQGTRCVCSALSSRAIQVRPVPQLFVGQHHNWCQLFSFASSSPQPHTHFQTGHWCQQAAGPAASSGFAAQCCTASTV